VVFRTVEALTVRGGSRQQVQILGAGGRGKPSVEDPEPDSLTRVPSKPETARQLNADVAKGMPRVVVRLESGTGVAGQPAAPFRSLTPQEFPRQLGHAGCSTL
jgi:hypothetical protein